MSHATPKLIQTRLLDFVLGFIAGFLGAAFLSVVYGDSFLQGLICSLILGLICAILTFFFGRRILKYLFDGLA